jgi:hypothetical protein
MDGVGRDQVEGFRCRGSSARCAETGERWLSMRARTRVCSCVRVLKQVRGGDVVCACRRVSVCVCVCVY